MAVGQPGPPTPGLSPPPPPHHPDLALEPEGTSHLQITSTWPSTVFRAVRLVTQLFWALLAVSEVLGRGGAFAGGLRRPRLLGCLATQIPSTK